jgi:organic anion transporter 5A
MDVWIVWWLIGWMDERMERLMVGYINECLDGWLDVGWVDEWIAGWMDGWIVRLMVGWMDR